MILDLYDNLRPYHVYDIDEPYSRSFVFKTGREVRIFDIEFDLGKIGILDNFIEIRNFLIVNRFVYFIPLETPTGKIFAFVLKSVREKKFMKVPVIDGYPYFFGMGPEFMDFKYGDFIVLSEGVKDALAIKTEYKYSMAYLTARPEEKFWSLLSKLTNRFIIFGDNDRAGKKLKYAPEFRACAIYYVGQKDAGEYFDRRDDRIRDDIRQVLRLHQIGA